MFLSNNKKNAFILKRTKANFRGTTFIHRFIEPMLSTPDHHQGCAVTGLPVPVYFKPILVRFFGILPGDLQGLAFSEGFQPSALPLCGSARSLTPPG